MAIDAFSTAFGTGHTTVFDLTSATAGEAVLQHARQWLQGFQCRKNIWTSEAPNTNNPLANIKNRNTTISMKRSRQPPGRLESCLGICLPGACGERWLRPGVFPPSQSPAQRFRQALCGHRSFLLSPWAPVHGHPWVARRSWVVPPGQGAGADVAPLLESWTVRPPVFAGSGQARAPRVDAALRQTGRHIANRLAYQASGQVYGSCSSSAPATRGRLRIRQAWASSCRSLDNARPHGSR